jgi:hypothetical protein
MRAARSRHIMKTDDESINKGKPVERRRRKAMGLLPSLPNSVMIARLLIDTVAELTPHSSAKYPLSAAC